MSLLWRNPLKQVQADGEVMIDRVEIGHVIGSPSRNVVEEFVGKVAVRINQCDPMSGFNVLNDHVSEEGRLSGARFADHIQVMPSILTFKTEGMIVTPDIAFSKL